MTRSTALALLLAVVAAASVRADTVNILASLDNTIIQHPIGEFSNGSGDYFFAGIVNNFEIRRGLIAFDVASAIPARSTITSVTVRLRMSRSISGSHNFSLHRVLAQWGEGASNPLGNEGSGDVAQPGDATWLHRMVPDLFWTTEGGDFDPAPSASRAVGSTGFYTWTGAQLTADVQAWLDNDQPNYGWLLRSVNEGEVRSAKRFDSRSHPTAANRPVLIVEFTPPAPCPGDANGDGAVNAADLSVLLSQFGSTIPAGTDADFNNDGIVDAADLSVLLTKFGTTC